MKLWKHEISLDPLPLLIGFLQGLGFYVLDKQLGGLPAVAERTLALFLILAPSFLMLAIRPASRVRDLAVACGVGAFFAALYALFQTAIGISSHGSGAPFGNHMAAAIASTFILLCFYQAGRDERLRSIPYAALFQAAWGNLLRLTLAALFIFVVFLVLYLWGQLFNLIGLTIFKTVFAKAWFAWPFYGAAFGLGVALLRELEAPILAVRRLILAAFRVLAVIVAFAGLLFLLALPMTGLALLWETRQATPILLSMVIAFVLFVNGAIQDGAEERPFWRPAALLVKIFLIALPIYGALAFYSTSLRVAQYGLTPDRVLALVLAGLAILYGLAYAAAVVLKRPGWVAGLIAVNPRLALLMVAVGILLQLPGIDPVSLSARNQLSRLQNGTVAAADFDFGALKFELAKPGLRALDKIRHDPALSAREDVQNALADLANAQGLHDWRLAQDKVRKGLTGSNRDNLQSRLQALPVFPSSALMPERFLPAFIEMSPDQAKACVEHDASKEPRCAIILLDFNRDGYDDSAVWSQGLTLYLWNSVKNSYEAPIFLSSTRSLSLADLRAADSKGEIHIVPARVDSLMVGGIRFD